MDHRGLQPQAVRDLVHTRQGAARAPVQNHVKQNAASRKSHTQRPKLQGVGWLDLEEDQSKTVPTVPRNGVQKGQEGREKHSVGDPSGCHLTCLSTLSPSKKQVRQVVEHRVGAASHLRSSPQA